MSSASVARVDTFKRAAIFLPFGEFVLVALLSLAVAAVVRDTNLVTADFRFLFFIWSARADGSLAENGTGTGPAILAGMAAPKLDGK